MTGIEVIITLTVIVYAAALAVVTIIKAVWNSFLDGLGQGLGLRASGFVRAFKVPQLRRPE